jgi:transposase
MHSDGEAERFYRELKQKGVQVRVGIEATVHSRWFERLPAELDFELWVVQPLSGPDTQIRTGAASASARNSSSHLCGCSLSNFSAVISR